MPTSCEGSAYSHGVVLKVRLSICSTVGGSKTAARDVDDDEEDVAVEFAGLEETLCVLLYVDVGASCPPSAILMVISGDVATMISRVELSLVSTGGTAGVSDASRRPAVGIS